MDALQHRFSDATLEIERATDVIRLIIAGLLQEGSDLPSPRLQRALFAMLQQCAYIREAASLACQRIAAATAVRTLSSVYLRSSSLPIQSEP